MFTSLSYMTLYYNICCAAPVTVTERVQTTKKRKIVIIIMWHWRLPVWRNVSRQMCEKQACKSLRTASMGRFTGFIYIYIYSRDLCLFFGFFLFLKFLFFQMWAHTVPNVSIVIFHRYREIYVCGDHIIIAKMAIRRYF